MKVCYFLLLIFSVNVFSVNSQIIYTDINPDAYITNLPQGNHDIEAIDVDQDGIIDFSVHCYSFFQDMHHQNCCWYYEGSIEVNPGHNIIFAEITGPFNGPCYHVLLDSNVWVDSTLYFPQVQSYSQIYSTYCFNHISSQKYHAFRKISGSDTLYGWIRMAIGAYDISICDVAINTSPNMGLYTGALNNSISEYEEKEEIRVFPTVFSEKANFINYSPQIKQLLVLNVLGEIKAEIELSSFEIYEYDFSDYPVGIYFVCSANDGKYVKVIKQ